MWRSEDSLTKSVFSFYLVDYRGQTQVTRLGVKNSPVKINMSTKVESVEKKHSSQRDRGMRKWNGNKNY